MMSMEIVAIDVETVNVHVGSIRQIGLAHYSNEEITEEYGTYIKPQDYFDPINISIQEINENTVISAPKFDEV